MLNEFPCMAGDYLMVVDGLLGPGDIETIFFALSIMVGSDTFS